MLTVSEIADVPSALPRRPYPLGARVEINTIWGRIEARVVGHPLGTVLYDLALPDGSILRDQAMGDTSWPS